MVNIEKLPKTDEGDIFIREGDYGTVSIPKDTFLNRFEGAESIDDLVIHKKTDESWRQVFSLWKEQSMLT